MIKKLLGYAAVDSGQLIIADPCYLGEWEDGEHDQMDNHYGKACNASDNKERGGEFIIAGIRGTAVCFGTGGDGSFPIIAKYNKDGSIRKIEILVSE